MITKYYKIAEQDGTEGGVLSRRANAIGGSPNFDPNVSELDVAVLTKHSTIRAYHVLDTTVTVYPPAHRVYDLRIDGRNERKVDEAGEWLAVTLERQLVELVGNRRIKEIPEEVR